MNDRFKLLPRHAPTHFVRSVNMLLDQGRQHYHATPPRRAAPDAAAYALPRYSSPSVPPIIVDVSLAPACRRLDSPPRIASP